MKHEINYVVNKLTISVEICILHRLFPLLPKFRSWLEIPGLSAQGHQVSLLTLAKKDKAPRPLISKMFSNSEAAMLSSRKLW